MQRKLGLENNMIESMAGLARLALDRGDLADAKNIIEPVLAHLEQQDLQGTDEPLYIYLTCYEILKADQDYRTDDHLDQLSGFV